LIEVVLTIALVVPFSMYLLYYYAPPSYPDAALYDAAATAVTALDAKGILLSLLVENNALGLQHAIRSSLPADVDFVLLYSRNGEAPTRVGPSQVEPNSVQVQYAVVAPDGDAFHLTLLVWRR